MLGAARRDIDALLHAAVDDGRKERRRQQLDMRALDLGAGRDHALHEKVNFLRERLLDVRKRLVFREIAEVRRDLLARDEVFAAIQRELERLAEIEHRRIAPAEIVALRRELHAADDGVVARLLRAETELLERRDNRLVIEELRHAAALRDDADGFLEQRVARLRMKPHGKIRLRQAEMRLRLQAEERDIVDVVVPRRIDAADRHIEPNRESREILRTVAVPQIHDLVELQPEAFEDFERPHLRHARFAAPRIVRREDFIEAPR